MNLKRLVAYPQRRRSMKQEQASQLRNAATDAERKLWSMLRNKQFGGLRFRRQQPIGPYIVDFFCSPAKLIVELDGDQHGEDRNVLYDEARTRWLSARGYSILRFPNGEFLKHPEIVVESIWNALESSAIPLPKPPKAV